MPLDPSLEELSDEQQRQMTHYPEPENPVPGMLGAARGAIGTASDYWQSGLSANPTIQNWLNQIPGSQTLQGLLQSQTARDAFGTANTFIPPALLGIYGGKAISALSPEEVGKLNAWLKDPNHLNEYFAGMHNPKNMRVFFGEDKGKPYIDIGGDLYVNREKAGSIQRKIYPEKGTAYHGSLSIDDNWKGRGLGKKLSLAHLGVYQKTGINKSSVYAVSDGSAFWAHLGYLPNQDFWINNLRPYIEDTANEIGGIDLQTRNYLNKVLKSDDPRAIWDISDITSRHPSGELIGNKLLRDLPWPGEFDLTNPEQVERMRTNAGK